MKKREKTSNEQCKFSECGKVEEERLFLICLKGNEIIKPHIKFSVVYRGIVYNN